MVCLNVAFFAGAGDGDGIGGKGGSWRCCGDKDNEGSSTFRVQHLAIALGTANTGYRFGVRSACENEPLTVMAVSKRHASSVEIAVCATVMKPSSAEDEPEFRAHVWENGHFANGLCVRLELNGEHGDIVCDFGYVLRTSIKTVSEHSFSVSHGR